MTYVLIVLMVQLQTMSTVEFPSLPNCERAKIYLEKKYGEQIVVKCLPKGKQV